MKTMRPKCKDETHEILTSTSDALIPNDVYRITRMTKQGQVCAFVIVKQGKDMIVQELDKR